MQTHYGSKTVIPVAHVKMLDDVSIVGPYGGPVARAMNSDGSVIGSYEKLKDGQWWRIVGEKEWSPYEDVGRRTCDARTIAISSMPRDYIERGIIKWMPGSESDVCRYDITEVLHIVPP